MVNTEVHIVNAIERVADMSAWSPHHFTPES